MKTYVGQTRVRYESHTSDNLSEIQKCAVAEWDLKLYGHMSSLTTDNAKNMNAEDLARMKPYKGCVAHTINLTIQKGLQVPCCNHY